ncbi:Para-hydroxybenzoate--polyprenyltransferase, mitochondrial precursor (PHB:polyprenyltransferase) [Serendipita sp. 399]|nr:Para-hydroxybenzoate--polyprenyltransferase, mitochondrial precursor (PHB:polyprenyltransferase) [Serendipita sp. 399]
MLSLPPALSRYAPLFTQRTRGRWLATVNSPSDDKKSKAALSSVELAHPERNDRSLDSLKAHLLPYWHLARLDKPIGTVLLFLPCTWSITMASYASSASPQVLFGNIALFGIGALLMRGAGCTINDLWDRDLDKGVERTRSRPLASGALTVPQAVGFLGLQLAGGLAVLTQLNWYSIQLGASSLLLVGTYPLMKRITYWPQLVLGLTFNWGALLGWSAVTGTMDWSVCAPLYASGILWTLVYDTAYAHQDKSDDAIVGIKSTALLFGENTKPILAAFLFGSCMLAGLAGLENEQGLGYFSSLAIGTSMLALKLRMVNFDIPHQGGLYFRYCGYFGWMLFAGALVDYLISYANGKKIPLIEGWKQQSPARRHVYTRE